MSKGLQKRSIIALVSQQRSGTTVFRQLLGSGGSAFDLGEIFHGNADTVTNFWGFLASRVGQEPRLVCPHYWYDVWEEYLQEQYKVHGHKIFIIDLKMDYLRFILTHHDYSPTRYFFFDVSNFKFIYLERKNVAAQVVSRLRAEKTGEWGVIAENAKAEQLQKLLRANHPLTAGEIPENIPTDEIFKNSGTSNSSLLRVEPVLLEKEIENMILSNRFGLSFIERYQPLKLAYEELFDSNGLFDEVMIDRVSQFVGMNAHEFERIPLTKRQSGASFMDSIENKVEIMSHFKGTPFEPMFASQARLVLEDHTTTNRSPVQNS